MDRTVETTALGGSGMPEFTPWALFLHADLVGQFVVLILLIASFWTWAIVIDKWLRLRRLQAAANQFEDQFWSGGSLEDLYDRIGAQPGDPMTAMFGAAMREWRRTAAKGLVAAGQMRASLQARIERVMQVTLSREMDRLEKQMTFLASVGSTAPFIGLFGTVWGIMRSFHSIGRHEEHLDRVGRPRPCRGAVRHGTGSHRRDPGGHRLQQDLDGAEPLCGPARDVLLGVRRHPVAPARREELGHGRSSYAVGSPGRVAPRCPARGRDQRHAVRRRDARAAGDLHDHGAAADLDRAGRPAADAGRARHRPGRAAGRLGKFGRQGLPDGQRAGT